MYELPGSLEGEAEQSLYQTMELSILATEQEIRQQFRKLALRHHPDKVSGSASRFQAIREAFDVLSDPVQRAQYDKTLVCQLDIEEYLGRFTELVLTVQGFSLPLHSPTLHRMPQPQQAQQQQHKQQQQRQRRCVAHHGHAVQHAQVSPSRWSGMLTRA